MNAGIATLLDSRRLEPAERAEGIRELIWDSVVRVEITHHPQPQLIDARGAITDLGAVNVCSVRSNATLVQRTPRLVRDDMAPSLFLGLQVSGSSMVVQSGRECVLRPGDLAVYDTTLPYTLVNAGGIHQHFFRFAIADLALPHDAVRSLTAVRLGREPRLAQLAACYFMRVAEQCPSYTLSVADAVSRPSLELLRALLASHLPDEALGRDASAGALQMQIMEYVRAHLADPDLNAAQIAAAHYISVRHLYTVLGRAGISLGDWIRTHRLEQCRHDLRLPAAASMTIAAIAHRWGFRDATNFGRAFRAVYGLTPREWRDAQLPSGD